jgi:hypothetical protein
LIQNHSTLNDLFSSHIRFYNIRHFEVIFPLADQFLSVSLYLTNNSIRRLDLQSYHYQKRDRCFNSQQCATFIRSPLAKQCEVLQIVVDNRSSIDDLINGMPNLQALKVVLQPGQQENYLPSTEESIKCMTSGYSRTFTENLTGTEIIRLWIR